MATFKFFNIGKANAEIQSAEDAINPAIERAGIKTIAVDGKTVAQHEAPLAARISALLNANPPGAELQQASELLASNDLIAKRCEKAESDLAIAQTSVATLTTDNARCKQDLSAALASVATLTAQQADLNNRLQAAVNQFTANAKELAQVNGLVSEMCLSAGCLELSGLDKNATAAQKVEAANAIPVADKLTAFKGAVNTTLSRIGVSAESIPNSTTQSTIGQSAILAQLDAIKDPKERAIFHKANSSKIFSAMKSLAK